MRQQTRKVPLLTQSLVHHLLVLVLVLVLALVLVLVLVHQVLVRQLLVPSPLRRADAAVR